jgi:rhodanese-related sulfurtransferase
VVLDVRRVDEYQTMNIPGSLSVPGAELVLRARALAPDPATRIIVNCAGRTRSIIGTQSLVNAGIPNPVAALRNGTIGWLLAGQALEHGANRRGTALADGESAAAAARQVATRAGVRHIGLAHAASLERAGHTLYRLDVRTPEEYEAGHLPGFANAPGGQLVQETDHTVPVRGARVLLADDTGVRADMTASWLAQMGWDVWVLEPHDASARSAAGPSPWPLPPVPAANRVSPGQLSDWLQAGASASGPEAVVVDVAPGVQYVRRHIAQAWFAIRAQLRHALNRLPPSRRYVFTCSSESERMARLAAADFGALTGCEVFVLAGGTPAWAAAGLPVASGEDRQANPRTDRYRRPYEGTDAPREAMQAYLDWEFGLVAQLARDGTHHFKVI